MTLPASLPPTFVGPFRRVHGDAGSVAHRHRMRLQLVLLAVLAIYFILSTSFLGLLVGIVPVAGR